MVVPLLMLQDSVLVPLLLSLYSFSQDSVSHFLALVTTCWPTAPKSLSLAQPSLQTHNKPKDLGVSLETHCVLS